MAVTRKELTERYVALAAALLETRPFISETQYHRMKQSRTSPGYYLILQWENCVNGICRTLARLDTAFDAEMFLHGAGFIQSHGLKRRH